MSRSLSKARFDAKDTVVASVAADSIEAVADSDEEATEASAAPNEAAVGGSDPLPFGAPSDEDMNPIFAVAMLLAFSLALPLLVILGSFPSGLISALIIGIGMHQAWTMTRASSVTIAGPFKVGRRRSDAQHGRSAATAA